MLLQLRPLGFDLLASRRQRRRIRPVTPPSVRGNTVESSLSFCERQLGVLHQLLKLCDLCIA